MKDDMMLLEEARKLEAALWVIRVEATQRYKLNGADDSGLARAMFLHRNAQRRFERRLQAWTWKQ